MGSASLAVWLVVYLLHRPVGFACPGAASVFGFSLDPRSLKSAQVDAGGGGG